MQTRPGTPADLPEIEAFDCFGGDRPGAINEDRCIVAVIDDQIAGYIVYKRQALIGKNFIEFLVVNEPYRRRGIAVALLRAAEQTLGTCRLYISTGQTNTRMQALLAKDGWTPAGQIEQINSDGTAELFYFREVRGDPS